jgi:hypothetical protein
VAQHQAVRLALAQRDDDQRFLKSTLYGRTHESAACLQHAEVAETESPTRIEKRRLQPHDATAATVIEALIVDFARARRGPQVVGGVCSGFIAIANAVEAIAWKSWRRWRSAGAAA